jgi:hypothetical protein
MAASSMDSSRWVKHMVKAPTKLKRVTAIQEIGYTMNEKEVVYSILQMDHLTKENSTIHRDLAVEYTYFQAVMSLLVYGVEIALTVKALVNILMVQSTLVDGRTIKNMDSENTNGLMAECMKVNISLIRSMDTELTDGQMVPSMMVIGSMG